MEVAYWSKVSVLFSEPKIPQSGTATGMRAITTCFSALQRAENSSISFISIRCCDTLTAVSVLFSEPKIPQFRDVIRMMKYYSSFSALQRAENSSILQQGATTLATVCFSALQRAENSSTDNCFPTLAENTPVSVLFSEPKIPQYNPREGYELFRLSFSALQRAENSSIFANIPFTFKSSSFSALQRAENSSICLTWDAAHASEHVSVLFSEPKIPQYIWQRSGLFAPLPFQCSSASRKFLNAAR